MEGRSGVPYGGARRYRAMEASLETSSSRNLIVYLNGRHVPADQAVVSIFDQGFLKGDSVYDTLRTVRHQPYKLREHLERFYRNLSYMRLDPGLDLQKMEGICQELVQLNVARLRENEDLWVNVRVSRGVHPTLPRDFARGAVPTVIVYTSRIDFAEFAREYRTGRRYVTASTRSFPAACLEPRIKGGSRQHFMRALIEAQDRDPQALPLLLDVEGNLTEPWGANFFFASSGTLKTASRHLVLEGITRETVLQTAEALDIPTEEGDSYKPYDVYTADEAFVTATSFAVLPVCSLDGVRIGGEVPGPITRRLIRAVGEQMGVDLVAQAMSHLPA
jgi:branched-chain amino acid aminotransferase